MIEQEGRNQKRPCGNGDDTFGGLGLKRKRFRKSRESAQRQKKKFSDFMQSITLRTELTDSKIQSLDLAF